MAPGTFTVSLSATTTPNSVINSIDPWGQILIHTTRVDENTISNQDMIATARYVGVVQNLEYDLDSFQVSGKGTMVYLGDTDSRGLVVAETSGSGAVRSYTNDSFSDVLDRTTSTPYGLLRTGDTAAQQAVRTKSGSITNPTSGTTTYTGDHYLESTFRAVKYVAEHFECEFFVDNEGFIFAGRPEVLFNGHNNDPDAIIIRQGQGEDPNIEGFIPAGITTGFNAEEYVSKVELIPTGETKEVSMADASVTTNQYKDLFDANLKRIQVVKDASATQSNFQARANKALSEYNRLKKTVNVSLEGYDISGSFKVGDKIFIYDPDVGFEDTSSKAALESRDIHQVTYQGSTINPEKIRVVGMSYPVQDGMGVYYRNSATGVITDLTDYIIFESGDISLEIGDVGQTLSTDFSTAASVIAVDVTDDFTVPDQPTKPSNGSAGFDHSVGTYRDGAGAVKGFIKLDWTKPQNKNGTTILDGSHFLIQWRMVSDRDGNSILDSNDVALDTSDYQSASVDFDQSRYIIENLNIGFTYTVRLFAFDLKNHSSDVVQVAAIQIPRSSIAPNKPAKPENTFGSLASGLLRAQIVHKLAQVKDDDGNVIGSPINFSLDRDISHLNVYGAKATFNLSYDSTNKKVADSDRDTYYLGMLPASNGNIDLNIPVVGTVNLDSLNLVSNDTVYYRISAVNISGRESEPSDVFDSGGANTLIDTQHIKTAAITTALIGTAQITDAEVANMNVNKLTSGSIAGKTFTLLTDSGTQSTIESSGFNSGSSGFQIKSNGDVEFNSGNFRGDITGASGTFSGSLSSGVSITAPTISGGSVSGTSISGGTIDIGGSDSTSFHVDSDGNMFLGAASIGSAPFKVTKEGALTATSVTASDVFVSGVAINPSSTTSAINMDDTSTLTSNFTASGSGTFRTASSGQRVEISSTHGPEVRFFNSSGADVGALNQSVSLLQLRTGAVAGNNMQLAAYGNMNIASAGSDGINFSSSVAGNGKPEIRIGGAAATNKYLIANSDGKLDYSSASVTGGVTSITASGELSLTGGGTGDVTITHADSDHDDRFYTKSTNDILLAAKAASGHSHSTSDISGGVDNYDHWTLNANGATDISSGETVEFTAGSNMGISRSGNSVQYIASIPSLSLSNTSSDNASYPFVTSVSGHTITRTRTVSASINTQTIFPRQNLSYNLGSFGQVWATVYRNSESSGSDQRKKENIETLDYGIDFINQLQPKKFNWKSESQGWVCNICGEIYESEVDCTTILSYEYPEEPDYKNNTLEELSELSTPVYCTGTVEEVFSNVDLQHYKQFGFMAQDILPLMPDDDTKYQVVNYDEDTDNYFYSADNLVAVLTKAVQELSTQVSDLTARIEALEG